MIKYIKALPEQQEFFIDSVKYKRRNYKRFRHYRLHHLTAYFPTPFTICDAQFENDCMYVIFNNNAQSSRLSLYRDKIAVFLQTK